MSKHEIIVKGGLGNQIFCLFYAYKKSLEIKKKVSLNLTNYYFNSRKDRIFLLNSLYPLLKKEFKISSSINSKILYFFAKFYEKFFVRSKEFYLPGDKNFFIKYWPNRFIHSGYFQKINDSEFNNKCINLLKKNLDPDFFQEKFNYLAIHLRRGDYLEKKHSVHGVIHEKYFIQEAKIQLKKHIYDGIKIFSDSPDLIEKDIFKILHENIIIDEGGETLDVFRRMANHKGLIASNSSFSLWAGILGNIEYFSIPNYWMKNVKSSILGFETIKRYECFL